MNRTILTIMAGMIAALAAGAESHVSTEPQPRAALIEEYTGINCVYCPQAHNNARLLGVNHPGASYTAAIHYGAYSNPQSPASDFRTKIGGELNSHFGIAGMGYPSSMISRRVLGGEGRNVHSYHTIPTLALQVHEETANVNLWARAEYDAETRDITLDVEAYFLNDVEGAKLVAYLLQNNVSGPQTGAAQVGMSTTDYNHMHMLRDILTSSLWGDAIDKNKKGETYTTTLTYNLPEEIKFQAGSTQTGIPTNPADMELLVYVLNDKGEVENVINAHPALKGMECPNNVRVSQPMIPLGSSWGFGFIDLVVDNYTDAPLAEATFKLILGTEETTVDWKPETPFAPYESRYVSIPFPEGMRIARDSGNRRFRIELMTANGKDVTKNTYISGSVRGPKGISSNVRIAFHSDAERPGAKYRILDFEGNTVKEFGPFATGEEKEVNEIVELEADKDYCFEIYNELANGIDTGTVTFSNANDEKMYELTPADMGYYGGRLFFYTTDGAGISGTMAETATPLTYRDGHVASAGATIRILDLSGRQISEGKDDVDITGLAAGVYVATNGTEAVKIVK